MKENCAWEQKLEVSPNRGEKKNAFSYQNKE
jgi:hypothetical protein